MSTAACSESLHAWTLWDQQLPAASESQKASGMPGWEGPVHRQVSVDCFLKCISLEHTHQVNYKVSAEHIGTDQKGLLQDFLVGFHRLRTLWVEYTFPQLQSPHHPLYSLMLQNLESFKLISGHCFSSLKYICVKTPWKIHLHSSHAGKDSVNVIFLE